MSIKAMEKMVWFKNWKLWYGLRETGITKEADDIPQMTIKSSIERLSELTDGYDLNDQ